MNEIVEAINRLTIAVNMCCIVMVIGLIIFVFKTTNSNQAISNLEETIRRKQMKQDNLGEKK